MLQEGKNLPSQIGDSAANVKCVGVATQACRLANNGQEMLASISERMGVDLIVISQEEEGATFF